MASIWPILFDVGDADILQEQFLLFGGPLLFAKSCFAKGGSMAWSLHEGSPRM